MFDIFCIGSNTQLTKKFPYTKVVESREQIKSNTKMYWLVEPNIDLVDDNVLDYRPEVHDQNYEHVWKWDNTNYGGIRLIPTKKVNGTKYVNKVVCKKSFDILYTKTPDKYFDNNKFASHVWCVDPEYKLSSDIDWAPDNFEPDYIHSFHLYNQLEHKYPDEEGGVKLFPREWKSAQVKYHSFLDASIKYPVLYVNDVNDYSQRDVFNDEYVWLIDKEYKIDSDTLNWVPNPFEAGMIHCFKLPHQLKEKYPMAMGGIRLVPKKWKNAELKIASACPIKDEKYDVFYINEDEFNADTYIDLAERSRTEWFWVVDREFDFNGELLFVPASHEQDYIHVFKIPGMLEERYLANVTQPWDTRCGGVRLVNKNFDITKHKLQNVVPVKYDIFYTANIKNFTPYIRKSTTKMFWLIDSEYQLDNNFNVVVPKHEQKFLLNFQISSQLRHKYPDKEGGVYLVPKTFNEQTQIKYKGPIGTDSKQYPVKKVKDVTDLKNVTEDCWVIDEEYQIDHKIDWAPTAFERNSIHTFHVKGQLQHKYPEQMGGVRWVPLDWDGNYVIHSEYITTNLHYPVLKVDDVEDISKVTTDCWLIDKDYEVTDKIDWTPPYFEKNSIHVFHVGNQLRSKYPDSMGGMRWVPVDWNGEYVIHKEFLQVQKEYPVYFVKDPTQAIDRYEDCWLADELYKIEPKINWIPDDFDKDKIHVFHVYEQLTSKYTESMGGLYWYPANRTNAQLKVHDKPLLIKPTTYPVYLVDDPTDFSTVTEDCWLVDKEYVMSSNITIVPWQNETEKDMVHVYHVRGQLEHKYPEEMGGVYWVPAKHQGAKVKIHDITPFGDNLKFEIFDDEETGRKKSTTGWFWVIDPNVELLPDFDLDFIPKVWDNGVTHVWQKLNPITGRQYDYSGVMLCPKIPQAKGRPKYMRIAACKQREYPVYTLTPADYKNTLQDAYMRYSTHCNNDMFWVVDAYVTLNPEFKFDYYPTQWDKNTMHVFQDQDGNYRNVRLVPKSLFLENTFSDDEIENNTFEKLKQINTVASLRPVWPVVQLTDLDKKTFLSKIENIKEPFVWTVDPDVVVNSELTGKGFMPLMTNVHKVHAWQKLNPITNKVHAYGGLRLWPTSNDYSTLTSADLKLNRMKNLQYVKQVGSTTTPYNVVFISYYEPNAEKNFAQLQDYVRANNPLLKLLWVRDVEGIFNAHKQAANLAGSKMFWVVDADAKIEGFDFSYIPDVYDEEVVHVWASKNPVTGLEYGYGGVKLFNREQVLNATSWGLDFTTGLSSRFKAMPEVSCVTRFNTDAYSTWRSAFRECVKLALKDDAESKERLEGWLHPVPDADFRHDAKRGAEEGRAYALSNKNNLDALAKINDYKWLKQRYESTNN